MTVSIRSVLAATDLSPASREVLQSAAALAAFTGAELHVLHAVEPALTPGEGVLAMQRRIHEARAALQSEVDAVLPPQARAASVRVAFQRPATAIGERADQVGADLIVIGPHRTRPFGDRLLGTTADRLVRGSTVPCLVVRGPLSLPVRRLVVPSDLSEVGQGTIAVARRWAEALQGSAPDAGPAELSVVHVDCSRDSEHAHSGGSAARVGELRRRIAEAAAGAEHAVEVEQQVLHGASPAEEILSFARATQAELLVMGTWGDRPLIKALLESVSAAVARRTEIPLLLIPPPVWAARQPGALTAAHEAPPVAMS